MNLHDMSYWWAHALKDEGWTGLRFLESAWVTNGKEPEHSRLLVRGIYMQYPVGTTFTRISRYRGSHEHLANPFTAVITASNYMSQRQLVYLHEETPTENIYSKNELMNILGITFESQVRWHERYYTDAP